MNPELGRCTKEFNKNLSVECKNNCLEKPKPKLPKRCDTILTNNKGNSIVISEVCLESFPCNHYVSIDNGVKILMVKKYMNI